MSIIGHAAFLWRWADVILFIIVFEIVFRKLAKLLHGMDSGKPLMNNECLWDKTQKAIKLHKYYNILGVNS